MTLRLCVILDRHRAPDPGARRFLAAIADDTRFDLAAVTRAPGPAPPLPRHLRRVLGAEARVFPAPDNAPSMAPESALPMMDFTQARRQSFDVVIDLGHGAPATVATARHGVWRLSTSYPGAGLAEARDRAPVTNVTLWCHRGDAPPIAIATARYDTKFLATRNAAFAREKSVQLVLRELARLDLAGRLPAPVDPPAAPHPMAPRDVPGYGFRTAVELGARTLNAGLARLGHRPGAFFLRLVEGDALDFNPARGIDLIAPGNAYWADPFLIEHAGTLYLFYEEFDYGTGLGYLAVGVLEGDRLAPLGRILERPHHLSYPFVFRAKGDILMIPETSAASRIEVWRATDFPTGWELVATALDGVKASDSVMFEHQGRWWLLTNLCHDSFGDFGSELHLFAIDGPMLNSLTPHPLNPVVIDASRARGGGRVFTRDGRLYRSSQDNTHGIYGFGLNLTEITELSDTAFCERVVRRVRPDFQPGIMGCHHMDAAAGRVVIDIRRRQIGARRSGRRQNQHTTP